MVSWYCKNYTRFSELSPSGQLTSRAFMLQSRNWQLGNLNKLPKFPSIKDNKQGTVRPVLKGARLSHPWKIPF